MPRTIRRPAAAVLALLACLAAGLTAGAGSTQAATPTAGTVSSSQPSVEWSGGPFLAANAVATTGCVVEDAPFCDSFDLTIGALDPASPDVIVDVRGDSPNDLYYAVIYGPDGGEVAAGTGIANGHHFVLKAPAPGLYSVRTELVLGVPAVSTYSGSARVGSEDEPIDIENACSVPVEDQAVLLTPDDGRRVQLDVLVVLDGITEEFARAFFDDVAVPYDRIDVGVRASYVVADPSTFTGTETVDLLNQLRATFPGGRVPAQFDIVELLTSRDLTLFGQTGIAGQADCLGGLAYDDRSFEVSEGAPPGFDPAGTAFGPLTLEAKVPAKITAHEMGHLLGGQHHYANCVEGNDPAEELSGDTSPCTLMFNAANFVSLDFSEVNARIARGYAVTYAAANDGGIEAANRAPVAADDDATVRRERSVVVAVLANDHDADGDALSVSGVGTPANGTARIVDGGVEYTPHRGFGGTDSFDYAVDDGRGGTDVATVRVTVEPARGRK